MGWWIWATVAAAPIAYYLFKAPPDAKSWDAKYTSPLVHKKELKPKVWEFGGKLSYPLPRNMVVYEYEEKKLIVHSPIAFNEEGMKQLDEIGSVKAIIVPNAHHTLDVLRYKEKYPDVEILCPAEIRPQIEKKLNISVDGTCEDKLVRYSMNYRKPEGVKEELAFEITAKDEGKVLIFCDLLFNLPKDASLISRLMGSAGFFGVTRIGRWFLVKDKKKCAKWLRSLAEELQEKLQAISVSHGDAVTEHAADKLIAAAERLE